MYLSPMLFLEILVTYVHRALFDNCIGDVLCSSCFFLNDDVTPYY
jgi:hypothetical protein